VAPELLQHELAAALSHRGRRLFQPLPCTQQELAAVAPADVAAAVEVMCGKPSPTTPSAITGRAGLEDPSAQWQAPAAHAQQQQQQAPPLLLYPQSGAASLGGGGGAPSSAAQAAAAAAAQRHSDSIGQICACVLAKLVVDLWLGVGGEVAAPLVLRMLQQALSQLQPQYRARAFDIVYNLSLHGCMLIADSPPSQPPSPQHQHTQAQPHQHPWPGSPGAQGVDAAPRSWSASPPQSPCRSPQPQHQQQQLGSTPEQPIGAGSSGGPASAAAGGSDSWAGSSEPSIEAQWQAWLLQLLCELLLMLAAVSVRPLPWAGCCCCCGCVCSPQA
jgi:hypothetical protein